MDAVEVFKRTGNGAVLKKITEDALLQREIELKDGKLYHVNLAFKRLKAFLDKEETRNKLLRLAQAGERTFIVPSEVLSYLSVEPVFVELDTKMYVEMSYRLRWSSTQSPFSNNSVLVLCWN